MIAKTRLTPDALDRFQAELDALTWRSSGRSVSTRVIARACA